MQFEEQLRDSGDVSDGTHDQAKARASIVYYCSRMVTVSPTALLLDLLARHAKL